MKRLLLGLVVLFFDNMLFAQSPGESLDSISRVVYLDGIKILASYSTQKGINPIVFSDINSEQITTKLSNQEFPEILKSTPSIYATKQGGGFGDSRITLRGFGSENIAVLINGIPINGMENASVYWSNWSGLSDVTKSIQVQRGIGLSKMGVSSVGGTINIITEGINAKAGATVLYSMGSDGYMKMGASLSTGMSKNGWAATILGSRTSGDGYVDATNFESWAYFLNLSKRINTNHLISLTALGASQWHNRRANRQRIEDYANNPGGIRMNTSYGYMNGNIVSTYSGYNVYHKPQISVNHFWSINHKSSLSSSVYASISEGGGRKVYGKDANRIQFDYKTGRPITGSPSTSLTPEGFIDYAPLMEDNKNSNHGSDAVFTMGTNAHNWYGLLSTYTNSLTNELKLTVGLDARYYKGYHYDEITDLLGGSYYKDNKLAWRDPSAQLGVGERVGQDYLGKVLWLGGFAQLAYTCERYNVFISTSVTDHMYRREDPGKYGTYSDPVKYPIDEARTSWRKFVPMSFKAGFNYRITNEHSLFINGGYVTRAPMMDNIFIDNIPIANPINEKIATAEIGYILHLDNLNVMLNAYYTKWMDKSVTKPIGQWDGPKACIPNIDAIHKGIELEADYRPFKRLSLGGFFYIGDWRWSDDVNFILMDDQYNKVGEYNAYIKDLHVGNAPQTGFGANVVWEPITRFFVGGDFNYYARHYADFSPADRTNSNDRSESWKVPNYYTFDLNMNYRLLLGKTKLRFIGNINNIFDYRYISDAQDGVKHDQATSYVWYGWGRTWSVGVQFEF